MNQIDKPNIFVLEDDHILSELLKTFLENNNFSIHLELNGDDAYQELIKKTFDLILLDISVPGMNGLELLDNLRKRNISTPVIVITGNTEDEEEIRSFKNGTNIFHKKPIQTNLLLYQMRSLLKTDKKSDEEITYKGLVINDKKKMVTYKDHEVNMSRNEYKTLLFLMRNQNRIVSKEQIIDNLYLTDSEVLTSSIDTLMSRIRKRLREANVEEPEIVTIRSFGYRLE